MTRHVRHWNVGDAHGGLVWWIHGSDGTVLQAPTHGAAQQIVAVLNKLENRKMDKDGAIDVTGIWLRREGTDAVMLFERGGVWIEAIREHYDGCFSHIVEVSGMRKLSREAAEKQSVADLVSSGGLVNAP